MLDARAIQESYEELLRSSWRTQSALLEDPTIGPWLLRCATPVLAFGRWQSAEIATAGLNPSEREFCDPRGNELVPPKRRFLHRSSSDGVEPSPATLAESRRLAEGYFELGNAYWSWFRGFQPLLDELGCTFERGRACHTDYMTPFATTKGIGSVPAHVATSLQLDGIRSWKAVLRLMPALRLVFGIGKGWNLMPRVFGFDQWAAIPTPFDSKGGGASVSRPYLLHKTIRLQHRPVQLFWWRPNRGEPLTWLNGGEKRCLAILMKQRVVP